MHSETDKLPINNQLRGCLQSYKTSEQWTYSQWTQTLTAFLWLTGTEEKHSNAEKKQEAHIQLRQIRLLCAFSS